MKALCRHLHRGHQSQHMEQSFELHLHNYFASAYGCNMAHGICKLITLGYALHSAALLIIRNIPVQSGKSNSEAMEI